MAHILQSHSCVETTELQDVHNGEAWLDAYSLLVFLEVIIGVSL